MRMQKKKLFKKYIYDKRLIFDESERHLLVNIYPTKS